MEMCETTVTVLVANAEPKEATSATPITAAMAAAMRRLDCVTRVPISGLVVPQAGGQIKSPDHRTHADPLRQILHHGAFPCPEAPPEKVDRSGRGPQGERLPEREAACPGRCDRPHHRVAAALAMAHRKSRWDEFERVPIGRNHQDGRLSASDHRGPGTTIEEGARAGEQPRTVHRAANELRQLPVVQLDQSRLVWKDTVEPRAREIHEHRNRGGAYAADDGLVDLIR